MLMEWKTLEVRKVRDRISSVENSLSNESTEPLPEWSKAVKSDAKEIMGIIHKTVQEIYSKYYPAEVVDFFCKYHSKERILKNISDRNVWILLCEGQMIGMGSKEENYITGVYVLPEFQKKGYGTRIVNALEKLIGKEYSSVVLDASLPACCMYEKMGCHTVRHEQMALIHGVILVYDVMEKCL